MDPNSADEEQQPLLGHPRKPAVAVSPLARWWARAMLADVQRVWADAVLLFCYIITGLLDSAAISTWGSFVSMQTGNTVYVGLGLAAPAESTRWIKSGTSLCCFCLGSFVLAASTAPWAHPAAPSSAPPSPPRPC